MSKKLISKDEICNYINQILSAYNADGTLISSVMSSFENGKYTAVRLNSLKMNIQEIKNKLISSDINLSDVSWSPYSFTIEDKSKLTKLPESRDGIFYIQNLSSQLTVMAMNPVKNQFILDLAAAPGGKTSFIAQIMNNQGRISAVEPVKDRYYRLIANLRSLGVTIAKCYNKDGRVVGKICPEWFDQVLLDAPCSSMAQIDFRDPESYSHWSMKKVKECSRKQKHLIESAFMSLKAGGEMIYSTCSWMVEENEEVIDYLLKLYPEQVEILPLNLPITNILNGLSSYKDNTYDSRVTMTARIIPNEYFEAFYIARLKKIS